MIFYIAAVQLFTHLQNINEARSHYAPSTPLFDLILSLFYAHFELSSYISKRSMLQKLLVMTIFTTIFINVGT